MSYRILLLFLAFYSFASSAQFTAQSDQYVVRSDSSTLAGNTLLYRHANDGSLFLMDYSVPLFSDSVVKFKNHHGTFIRVSKKMGKEKFAKRIRNGNISLYEPVNMKLYSDEGLNIKLNNGVSPHQKGLATGQKFKYYAMNDEAVKLARIRNMRHDMVDHSESWNHIKRYRKNQFLQGGLVGSGAGVLIYSLLSVSGGAGFNPLSLVGLVVAGSAVLLEPAKDDLKWMAFEAYNKR